MVSPLGATPTKGLFLSPEEERGGVLLELGESPTPLPDKHNSLRDSYCFDIILGFCFKVFPLPLNGLLWGEVGRNWWGVVVVWVESVPLPSVELNGVIVGFDGL